MNNRKNTLILFDVDGTLTRPRKKVTKQMLEVLLKLRNNVTIGIVGGSDIGKIKEQMGNNVIEMFDYCFAENGIIGYKNGELFANNNIVRYLGDDKINKFINYTLKYISNIDIPIKRGTFIEKRNGMFNVSPIGRNCSQTERDEFEKYDNVHKIRQTMVNDLSFKFGDEFNLHFSIGGQISFDVFPKGWDKTYCLQYVENDFENIYFFGDKTYKGGNDYEIYNDKRVNGIQVYEFKETILKLYELFLS
jgi:phosphomannomutase